MADIDARDARIRELEEALAPFANYAGSVLATTSKYQPGTQKYCEHNYAVLTIGDFRRACAAEEKGGAYDVAKHGNDPADGAGGVPFGNRAKPPVSSILSPEDFTRARSVIESALVRAIYASCAWDELSDDGRQWLAAIVREARGA